jgi:hypothetical protein
MMSAPGARAEVSNQRTDRQLVTLNRRGAFDWSQSSFSSAPISVTASVVEWPVLNEADGSAEGGGAEEDDGAVCCAGDDADADAGWDGWADAAQRTLAGLAAQRRNWRHRRKARRRR